MKKVFIAILYLIAFLMLSKFIDQTYSKYITRISVQASKDIAIPITNNNMNENLTVKLDGMVPGDRKSYNFSVTNYIGEQITEVYMEYSINIDKSSNIPVTIELYKNGVQTNILDSNLNSTGNGLQTESKQIDTYQLIVNWDSNDNNAEYNGLTDYLDIEINSIQIIN